MQNRSPSTWSGIDTHLLVKGLIKACKPLRAMEWAHPCRMRVRSVVILAGATFGRAA